MARYFVLRAFPQEATLKDIFYQEEYRATEAYLQAIPGVSVKQTAYPFESQYCPCSEKRIQYNSFEVVSEKNISQELFNLKHRGFWYIILEEDGLVKERQRRIVEEMRGGSD